MKEKHTLIVALVLLGLVSYYSFFESPLPSEELERLKTAKSQSLFTGKLSSKERDTKIGPPLLALHPGEVKRIEIKSLNGGEFIGEWKEGRLVLLKGNKVENWQTWVNDFIINLHMLVEIEKFRVEDSQLKDYGLANPVFQITLTDITDKTYQLLIGDTNPVRTSVYVKFADSPNVVIAGALLNYELQKIAPLLAPA